MLREGRSRTAELGRELLVSRGLKVTPRREAILGALLEARAPLTSPEIARRLSAELVRTTVFRNLLRLLAEGLIVRLRGGDEWRYALPKEERDDHRGHPHFLCRSCSAVECLSAFGSMVEWLPSRARVEEVELRGLCSSCSARPRRTSNQS